MSMSDQAFHSVYHVLAARAWTRKDKIAIRFKGQAISYVELLAQIEAAARGLAARGVSRGDVVATYAQNCPEILYVYFAAARLGAVFVPFNPNMTAAEVAYGVRHSEATLLLNDMALAGAALAASSADMIFPLNGLFQPNDAVAPDVAVGPNEDFLIIYTSGSTGAPKAIVLDHAALVNYPRALTEMWGVTADDVTVVALPLGYLYGLTTAAAAGLQSGGSIIVLQRFHPKDTLEALAQPEVSVFHGVPTMFSMMLEYCEQRDLSFDLSHLRRLISAGAPLSEDLQLRFETRFSKPVENYYSMTECTPVFGRYGDEAVPKGAAGRAAPGTDVRILRPDGSEAATGEPGELFVRSAGSMTCYLKDPVLTAASMVEGYFKSGDMGYRDSQGFYFISGRLKDIIIRGGANISPAEVENVLSSHPGVQDVCVIGGPDRIFGEVPVAFVVLRPGESITAEALIAHAEASLADFKIPRTIHFEEALPLGKTGKIDKLLLKGRIAPVA